MSFLDVFFLQLSFSPLEWIHAMLQLGSDCARRAFFTAGHQLEILFIEDECSIHPANPIIFTTCNQLDASMNALSSAHWFRKSSNIHGNSPAECEHECAITPIHAGNPSNVVYKKLNFPPRSSIFPTHQAHQDLFTHARACVIYTHVSYILHILYLYPSSYIVPVLYNIHRSFI